MLFDHPGQWEAPSLVGGGGSVLFEVFPGGILKQHVGAIGSPGHDVQTVSRLQRVLTPRACLMLCLLQRAGRLNPQKCPRTHKDWSRRGVLEQKTGKRKRLKMKTKHCKNERYHGNGRGGREEMGKGQRPWNID